jgi:hypothetical protein
MGRNMIHQRDLPEKKIKFNILTSNVVFEQLKRAKKGEKDMKPSNFLSRKVNGGVSLDGAFWSLNAADHNHS